MNTIYRIVWKADSINKGVMFVNAQNSQDAVNQVKLSVKKYYSNLSDNDFNRMFITIDVQQMHIEKVLAILNNAIVNNPKYFANKENL